MPRVNFYHQKHRKMKLSKFIILMAVIIGVGFLSYELIDVFVNDLYTHAISADRNLLENAGISLSMSKGQIQNRLDEVIKNYSNNLNVQSQLLLKMKDDLNEVNKFHSSIDVLDKISGQSTFTVSALSYLSNSATLLTFNQISLSDDSTILDLERQIIENSGYTFSISYPQSQNWYKASEEIISVGGYK
ncbi:hypothetical protein [Athalassotoga sp.]|uniref:hypothetical protein n=1 Tax=Athalassotoga sp. TaxID=2022597 RepID=UPI003CFDFC91